MPGQYHAPEGTRYSNNGGIYGCSVSLWEEQGLCFILLHHEVIVLAEIGEQKPSLVW